jgi:hypothetical protein
VLIIFQVVPKPPYKSSLRFLENIEIRRFTESCEISDLSFVRLDSPGVSIISDQFEEFLLNRVFSGQEMRVTITAFHYLGVEALDNFQFTTLLIFFNFFVLIVFSLLDFFSSSHVPFFFLQVVFSLDHSVHLLILLKRGRKVNKRLVSFSRFRLLDLLVSFKGLIRMFIY